MNEGAAASYFEPELTVRDDSDPVLLEAEAGGPSKEGLRARGWSIVQEDDDPTQAL